MSNELERHPELLRCNKLESNDCSLFKGIIPASMRRAERNQQKWNGVLDRR
jgi:hypothetical protein